jgi:hypothetical protein
MHVDKEPEPLELSAGAAPAYFAGAAPAYFAGAGKLRQKLWQTKLFHISTNIWH